MVLPGVPRTKRIQFVSRLIKLLLEEGLSGVSAAEHESLTAMINDLLSTAEPVPEKIEEEPEELLEPC